MKEYCPDEAALVLIRQLPATDPPTCLERSTGCLEDEPASIRVVDRDCEPSSASQLALEQWIESVSQLALVQRQWIAE